MNNLLFKMKSYESLRWEKFICKFKKNILDKKEIKFQIEGWNTAEAIKQKRIREFKRFLPRFVAKLISSLNVETNMMPGKRDDSTHICLPLYFHDHSCRSGTLPGLLCRLLILVHSSCWCQNIIILFFSITCFKFW